MNAFWDAATAFGDHLTAVRPGLLAVAIALHLCNLLLRATAWRNILAAAHLPGTVRWRSIVGAYFAGVGLNSISPIRGGDVMKVYLAHRSVPGAAYTTIVSSLVAETLFDALVGGVLLIWAISSGVLPFGSDILRGLDAFEWSFFADHRRPLLLMLAAALIAVGICFTWIEGHVTRFWERVRDGLAILLQPRRYLRQVVSLQALGWLCRMLSLFFFMRAFRLPAGLLDATQALSAGSLTTLMPLTPGGIGPQQAMLVYMFGGLASKSAVLSFSVGMQLTVTITNAIAGGIAMAVMLRRVPWKTGVPKGPDAEAAAAKPF